MWVWNFYLRGCLRSWPSQMGNFCFDVTRRGTCTPPQFHSAKDFYSNNSNVTFLQEHKAFLAFHGSIMLQNYCCLQSHEFHCVTLTSVFLTFGYFVVILSVDAATWRPGSDRSGVCWCHQACVPLASGGRRTDKDRGTQTGLDRSPSTHWNDSPGVFSVEATVCVLRELQKGILQPDSSVWLNYSWTEAGAEIY